MSAKIKAIDIELEKNDKKKDSLSDNKQNADKSIEKRQQNFDNLKHERDEFNAKVTDILIERGKISGVIYERLNRMEAEPSGVEAGSYNTDFYDTEASVDHDEAEGNADHDGSFCNDGTIGKRGNIWSISWSCR